MTPPSTDHERRLGALAASHPRRLPAFLARRRAAVAVILRDHDGSTELLFIERAVRHGDPWSGDVSFPGGLAAPGDADLDATAARETLEEVGIDLVRYGRRAGTLSERFTLGHDRRPLVVSPRIFALLEPVEARLEPVEARLGPEVRSAHWVPLAAFQREDQHARIARRYLGLPLSFECHRHGDLAIWGLTLRMVRELVRQVENSAVA